MRTALLSSLGASLGGVIVLGLLGPAVPAVAQPPVAPTAEVALPTGHSAAPKPGTVLHTTTLDLSPELAAVGTAVRVWYLSTAPDGTPTVVSGAVLTPRERPKPGHRDIVAWGHGTEGIADRCAPSRSSTLESDPNYPAYAQTVTTYLQRGWTVAATDYQGLGTPGPHPYLVGTSESRGLIDSVRAARQLDGTLSKNYVAVGHSQGGQAALFAGENRAYGKGLRLRGVVGMAAASDLDLVAPLTVGTPGNGYVVMGLYGLAAIDPTVDPERLLTPTAQSRTGVLETGCFIEVMTAFGDLSAEQLLVGGALPAEIVAKFAAGNAGSAPASAPVLLVHGTADESVPEFVSDDIAAAYCAQGARVQVNKYAGANHDDIPVASSSDVLDWIADRFARRPAPSICS